MDGKCSLIARGGGQCDKSVSASNEFLICLDCFMTLKYVDLLKRDEATREERERDLAARKQQDVKLNRGEFNVVYYVRMPGDLIKIGTTSQMAARLRNLTLNVSDLLACEPGSYDLERQRHKQFMQYQWRNSERFRAAPELLDHVASIRGKHGKPVLAGPYANVTYTGEYDYSP